MGDGIVKLWLTPLRRNSRICRKRSLSCIPFPFLAYFSYLLKLSNLRVSIQWSVNVIYMANTDVDVGQLDESQQEALQTYTSVTDQELSAAIPLLQRSQWNVQVSCRKWYKDVS